MTSRMLETLLEVLLSLLSVTLSEVEALSDPRTCPSWTIEGMSCVPAGPFIRGSEAPRTCPQGEVIRIPKSKPNHRPVSTIEMPTFFMDQTEVTFA
ncbi:MAG: hypothetical protein ACPHRO_05540, partial [Nannocystaceae bacterium]